MLSFLDAEGYYSEPIRELSPSSDKIKILIWSLPAGNYLELSLMKPVFRLIPMLLFLFEMSSTVFAVTVSDLILPGTTITSGDKVFSNFTWSSNFGLTGQPVNPADVSVSPFSEVVLGKLEYGLEFLTPTLTMSGKGGFVTVTMNYQVSFIVPGLFISGNTLTMEVSGQSGSANITQTPTDIGSGVPLLTEQTTTHWTLGFPFLSKHKEYLYPAGILQVNTEIAILGTGPSISRFTQTFANVPEPSSIAFVLMGAIATIFKFTTGIRSRLTRGKLLRSPISSQQPF